MKLFGFSKKEKISINKLAKLYASTLYEVVVQGFPEVVGFVNDNRKFEESPNLSEEDVKWFLMIVFTANNHQLYDFLDEKMADAVHDAIIQEMVEMSDEETDVVQDMVADYAQFFQEQLAEIGKMEKAMASCIFIKYNLNEYQGKLLKNQNEANPVFLQELTNLLSHFVWNWDDFLAKYKVTA